MNAGITTAKTLPAPSLSRKETEKSRLDPSSSTAGRKPMKSTVTQGKAVESMLSYFTSEGAQAPRRAATT